MNNFPVYFILGVAVAEFWKAGSHGLAGALILAAGWLAVSSYFAAKQRVEEQKFLQEIQAALKEKGY